MKLLKLSLKNFQGIKKIVLEPNGHSVNIYGENGSGKSTIANSITWALFDKSYAGEKGYTPKTTDDEGHDVHHLDHEVESVFEQDNGAHITIRRVYHEIWKKKRGTNTEEFSGHETVNYIDGVPVSSTEYKRTIESICAPDKAKILTSPRYFAENLHWEDRREILLEVCGDVTDMEIIQSNDALKDLYGYLRKPGTEDQFYSVDAFKKIAAQQKSDINRELGLIPARIEEVTLGKVDVAGLDSKEIASNIERLTVERSKVNDEIAQLSADGAAQTMREEMAKIRTQIAEGKAKINEQWMAETAAERRSIADLEYENEESKQQIRRDRQRISQMMEDKDAIVNARTALISEFNSVKGKQWDGETICPTCGQQLPDDKIEESRERFNQQRSRRLSDINARGKAYSKDKIELLDEEITNLTHGINEREDLTREIDEQIKERKAAVKYAPAYDESEEHAELTARMAEIERQLNDGQYTMSEAKKALRVKLSEIQGCIDANRDNELKIKNADVQEKRIKKLENEEKKYSKDYENIERGIWLCEEFTRAKVKMLDEKINSHFKAVRFRLFDIQINGAIKDDCTVLVPSRNGLVPWDAPANNAAKINAGLEIIETLGKHWGVSLPIVIDNAESVSHPIHTDAQQIRLYVSENDQKLRTDVQEA